MFHFKSVRHPLNYYFFLTAFCVFFTVLGFLLWFVLLPAPPMPDDKLHPGIGAFAGLLLPVFAFYTAWRFTRNAPILELDDTFIRIGNDIWTWPEVRSVSFSGKRTFPYLISFPAESVTIRFTDKTSRTLFENMYRDFDQLRTLLDKKINGKSYGVVRPDDLIRGTVTGDNSVAFRGNPVFSFRGLVMWSLPVFIVALGFIIPSSREKEIVGFMTAVFFLVLNSLGMFWFRVGREYFQVRNHYFFWIRISFRLSYIREAVFEQSGRQPNTLRLVTRDYKSKLYRAGSLTDATWRALKTELEKAGVKVRNECIPSK